MVRWLLIPNTNDRWENHQYILFLYFSVCLSLLFFSLSLENAITKFSVYLQNSWLTNGNLTPKIGFFFHFSFSVQWRKLMWFTYVDGNSCLRVPKKHNIFKIRFHLINSLYLDQSSNTGIIYYAALAQWFRALSSQAKDWLSVYYFPQQWQPYRKAWTATCIH